MRRTYRRRKFFVKQWLQLRYMVLLAVSTIVGGAGFGLVIRHILKKKLFLEMYRSHSQVRNMWEVLYPEVMRTTLILFVFTVAILFVLLKILAYRINRAGIELERHIDSVICELEPEAVKQPISVKEFKDFSERIDDLVRFYRHRWREIGSEARGIKVMLEQVAGEDIETGREEAVAGLERSVKELGGRLLQFSGGDQR